MSVVSRSVAGSVVAGSVRIPGRYRTPIPRTLLVVAVLVVAAVASLVFGSYQMSPDQVFRLIFQGEGTEIERQLVLNQRLPRMLAAVVVGAALGLSGAIFSRFRVMLWVRRILSVSRMVPRPVRCCRLLCSIPAPLRLPWALWLVAWRLRCWCGC